MSRGLSGKIKLNTFDNCLIREIFEATEEERKARYIAEEKAEAVLFYLKSYLPDFDRGKREITESIFSGKTEELKAQMMVSQSFQPQIVMPQPFPVWQMPYAPLPEQGIQIVVSYALPSGLIERAVFSPNNLNSALELFRNVNSLDVKIGAQVREHDLWMYEEKDGTRTDLFTETAFYQIGCSSPEVQLVRMIYGEVKNRFLTQKKEWSYVYRTPRYRPPGGHVLFLIIY